MVHKLWIKVLGMKVNVLGKIQLKVKRKGNLCEGNE